MIFLEIFAVAVKTCANSYRIAKQAEFNNVVDFSVLQRTETQYRSDCTRLRVVINCHVDENNDYENSAHLASHIVNVLVAKTSRNESFSQKILNR